MTMVTRFFHTWPAAYGRFWQVGRAHVCWRVWFLPIVRSWRGVYYRELNIAARVPCRRTWFGARTRIAHLSFRWW